MLLIQSYYRLLADIALRRRLHLELPENTTMSWVLTEGPALDKLLLKYLEDGLEKPVFPEWISPLWDLFVKGDITALKDIRQLLVFGYKAEFEPTDNSIRLALANFIEADEAIGVWDQQFDPSQPMFSEARRLLSRVLYRVNLLEILPSHGPGAVFPPRLPWNKSKFSTIYSSIQKYYPWDQFFCGLPSFWSEASENFSFGNYSEEADIICKLVPVPKDSRGPRLICVHPSEAIWIQQGQRRCVEHAIASSELTRGVITLSDQTTNGYLAQRSSFDKRFCTLDLKEASDRISCKLVQFLLGPSYDLYSCARATQVILTDGRTHHLRKWAPMGNCLTFPMQSLIFWSLVRAGIYSHYGVRCSEVFVFGDDILFPSEFYDGAVTALVRSGLVPNVLKTFRHGSFRESCGIDAFEGVDVTPYRMKVADIRSVSDVVSLCTLAKSLRAAGWLHWSSYLYTLSRSWLRANLHVGLPICNNPDCQGLFEYVMDARTVFLYGKVRFNRAIQIWESEYLLVSQEDRKSVV